MDGVLVDSGDVHFMAWSKLGEEIGVPHTRAFFDSTFGMHNDQIFPLWLGDIEAQEMARMAGRKEALYRDLAPTRLRALEGATELVQALHRECIPLAVGSSGPLANVALILRILGIEKCFSALSTGEDVTHGKPHPQVFQVAAQRLGVEPSACLVVEDAPQGIEAARRAGMKVVAVTSSRPAAELPADLVVTSLLELSVSRLRSLV